MADFNVGNLIGTLTIDVRQWQTAMRDALDSLNRFQQQVQSQFAIVALFQQALNGVQASATAYATAVRDAGLQTLSASTQMSQAATNAQAMAQQMAAAATAMGNVTTQAQNVSTALNAQHASTQKASSAWQDMLKIAGGLGIATGIGAVAAAIKNFAVDVLQTGMKLEQLRATFGAIAGSTREGAAQFQALIGLSQRLGFSLTGLAEGFRLISGATRGTSLAGRETMEIFTGVATAARAMGASQVQVERAILAIGQIVSKGVVQMEELRGQLAEAIPGAVGLAARGLGLTEEALNKFVATGQVRAIPFIQALIKQMKFELAPRAEEAAKTFGVAWQQLGTELTLLKKQVFDVMTKDFGGLVTLATALLGKLRDIRETSARNKDVQSSEEVRESGFAPSELKPDQIAAITALRQRMRTLDAEIAATEKTGTSTMLETRLERRKALDLELQTLLEQNDALRNRNMLEQHQTGEKNRQEVIAKSIVESTKDLKRILAEVKDEEAKFLKAAADQPNFLGSPTGTPEQQETFAKERQRVLKKPLEDLAEIVGRFPGGRENIPQEQLKGIQSVDATYGKLGKTVDELKEKERARNQAAAEALRLEEAARGKQIELLQTLERVRTFMRRPDENQPERARSLAEQQGAAVRADIEKKIEDLKESGPLRKREPQALQELQQALRDLPSMVTELGDKAFGDKIDQLWANPLKELTDQFTALKEARDEDRAATYYWFIEQTGDVARTEEAWQRLKRLQDSARVLATVPMRESEAKASKLKLEGFQDAEAFTRSIQGRLDVLSEPRNQREAAQIRARAAKQQQPLREQDEALLTRIESQERLNYVIERFEQLGSSVGQAWSSALQGIADGTKNVSDAFRDMALSILKSLSQIASQEAFKALIRVGAGLLTTALGGGGNAAAGSAFFGGGGGSGAGAFATGIDAGAVPLARPAQFGAVVNRPTLMLAGENPATSPEFIFNRQQMQSMLTGGPSAGGQAAGGISIINVGSRQQAEQEALLQRGMGRQVVINEVLSEMAQGEGSRIMQMVHAQRRS